MVCDKCGKELVIGDFPFCGGDIDNHTTKQVMIATDDFPGGYEVRHAVCNPDGTPRKFYSKTELKRALNEAGYTIQGDTPKPYNVHWSGRNANMRKRGE